MNGIAVKIARIVAFAILTVAMSRPACAQDAPVSDPQDGDSPPPSTASARLSDPYNVPPKPAGRAFMVLGTARLFALDQMLKSQVLFQMDLAEGYDDGIVLYPTRTPVYYTLWTPRVALFGRTAKSEYGIQYAPTVSYFGNAPQVGVQAFHQVQAELHTEVNEYWGWDVVLNIENGSYPVSLLNGFNFIPINGLTAVNLESILLLSTASYFNSNAAVGIHWKPSPRDTLLVSTTYNYANFPPNNIPGSAPGHLNRAILAANYTHSVSPRLTLLANGDTVHVFGPLACTTYGGQFGASYEIRQGTTVSGTVGPEFGAAPCSTSTLVQYTGYLTSQLSRNWSGYFDAARTNTGVVHSSQGSGLTETYGAGVMRQFGAFVDARVDAGYIRVKSLPTLPNSYNAQGKFISGRIDWMLAPPLKLGFQYSRIYQTVSGLTLDRNQAFVALEWTPVTKSSF